jgi:Transcriptional regulators
MSNVVLSQFAYEKIREMIRESKLSAGMKVSESKLANLLGVSRTPVREAIRQLQSEGLLYQIPQSGTYVSRPGRREIAEIYDVRMALEDRAILRGGPRLTHEQIDQLSQHYQRMHGIFVEFLESGKPTLQGTPLRSFLEADMAFHLVIFEAADNQTAIKIFLDVQMRNRGFGDQSHRRDEKHLRAVLHSHAAILRALQIQDIPEARLKMEEHLQNSLRDALENFDRLPLPPSRSTDHPDSVT